MIPHSQPYVTQNSSEALAALLENKALQDNALTQSVHSKFCKNFFLNNFQFTSSGTHALYWILKGLNCSQDDEIILPTYACSSLYDAIISAGAKPILCDIDTRWHISRENIEKKISKNTKAIILVNLFGVNLSCEKYRFPNVLIINDLCQSFDILRSDKKDLGDFAIFSFAPTKFITAGCGGGFSIFNTSLDFSNPLTFQNMGVHFSSLNMSILSEQIDLYDFFVEKRKKISEIYFSNVSKKYTQETPQKQNTFYRFPLVNNQHNFDGVQKYFFDKGIAVRRGVDELTHRILGIPDSYFPNAVETFNKTISIPIYPSLTFENAQYIASIVESL